jgi:O-methyltransferase
LRTLDTLRSDVTIYRRRRVIRRRTALKHLIKRAVKKSIRAFGFDVVRYRPFVAPDPRIPEDFSPSDVELFRAVSPFTMTTPERVFSLIQAVRYVVAHDVRGAMVECGVWKGGSMLAVGKTLLELGATDRELFLYDTYEGMTEPAAVDVSVKGEKAAEILDRIQCIASEDEVRSVMERSGYDPARIHLVKGRVEDTIPDVAPVEIALLRLDTDWYESTRHELVHLYPRLAVGGVLILDDYGHWQGARRAVDEYFAEHDVPMLLNRIDHTGRIGVKLR